MKSTDLPCWPPSCHSGWEEIAGIIVKFRNIEDIRTTIMERNTAIAAAGGNTGSPPSAACRRKKRSLQTYGSSAAMRAVRRRAYKLSQMDCNIFIIGETGTGRTRLAKSIQQVQPRGGPFLQTDCSAVAPGLLEEQLFGREGGVPGFLPGGRRRYAAVGRSGRLAYECTGQAAVCHSSAGDYAGGRLCSGACGCAAALFAGPELRDEVDSVGSARTCITGSQPFRWNAVPA